MQVGPKSKDGAILPVNDGQKNQDFQSTDKFFLPLTRMLSRKASKISGATPVEGVSRRLLDRNVEVMRRADRDIIKKRDGRTRNQENLAVSLIFLIWPKETFLQCGRRR